jgi:diacylglycerol kinase family enzyme
MPSSITVVVNRASACKLPAADDDVAARLQELFAAAGADAVVVRVCNGAELTDAARRAVAAGCRTIVAAGGDGTIGSVAAVVADTDAELGILPLGTLNHFAKDLGLPLDLEEAVTTIVAGVVRRVDVGEVNGRIFVNNSSLGLYPTLVKHREQHESLGQSKRSAFVRALLTVVGRYPFVRVAVRGNGASLVRKTPLVFIGNNSYHVRGLKLGTRDKLDSGLLSVYLMPDVGRLGLAWIMLRALCGGMRDEKDFESLETDSLTIAGRRSRLRVATDGEVNTLELPLEYRIRPGALKVIVPATAPS